LQEDKAGMIPIHPIINLPFMQHTEKATPIMEWLLSLTLQQICFTININKPIKHLFENKAFVKTPVKMEANDDESIK